jgi:hypothetical protein
MDPFTKYRKKEGIFANRVAWASAKTMGGGVWWRMYGGERARTRQSRCSRSFCANSCGSRGKELVHVWLHCQPPSQQAFCPTCQEARLCALQLLDNKRVTRKVKRVDCEAGAFEWDLVEGSDVPVEGSKSEDSKEEIEEGV